MQEPTQSYKNKHASQNKWIPKTQNIKKKFQYILQTEKAKCQEKDI